MPRKIGTISITFETGFYQVQKVAAAFQWHFLQLLFAPE